MERTLKFDEIDIAILRVAVRDHLAAIKEAQNEGADGITDDEIDQVDELLVRLDRQ